MRASFLSLVLFAACSGPSSTTSNSTTPIADPIPMPGGSAADQKPAGEPSAVAMLGAYEKIRAALAADDGKSVPDASRELEAFAQAAEAAALPATAPHFAAIKGGAVKLAAAKDIKAARIAFGEVSRHLVALLIADKSLARGQHVFECPMSDGYHKWIQPTEKLENPYMGQEMLACGSASRWE